MPVTHFSDATGLPWAQIADQVEQLVHQGLLEIHQQRLRTTDQGFLYLNDILSEWLA
jgi:oxygen-independent coproporphyrinogen-3 oxidase